MDICQALLLTKHKYLQGNLIFPGNLAIQEEDIQAVDFWQSFFFNSSQSRINNLVFMGISFLGTTTLNQLRSAVPEYKMQSQGGFGGSSGWTHFSSLVFCLYRTELQLATLL